MQSQNVVCSYEKGKVKDIVVFYSLTGKTERLARMVSRVLGAPSYRLEMENPYPAETDSVLDLAIHDIQEDVLPPLKPIDIIWDDVERVFVGTPNWFGTFAPPVGTFLENNRWEGKMIIPFCTNHGGHAGNIGQDMKTFCPHATVLACFDAFGKNDLEKSVRQWLTSIQ